jgi:phosphomannomutase
MPRPHRFQPSILREYDIRGIVGETLDLADATALGHAFVALTRRHCDKPHPRIAVARDGRLSSPELEAHLAAAIEAAGGIAVRIGCGPSPMLYFSTYILGVDAGIMVTGSHNPRQHNGFKMMIGGASVYGNAIQDLANLARQPQPRQAGGSQETADVTDAYVDRLVGALGAVDISQCKIGWDAGNGAAGEIMRRLTERLPGQHLLLNEIIDGHFPAHHPDPTEPENLIQLQELVSRHQLDLGIAFDGDGDRIGAVDAQGRIVWGDQLLAILSRDVLDAHPGAVIIADVKASQALFDEIDRLGGSPLMWKTGHSLIKSKMAETHALLAGEMSGHIFFADEYYGFDDALYAAVRLLRVISRSGQSLGQLRDQLKQMVNTPEIRIACPDERKFAVMQQVAAELKRDGADLDATDGVRVRHPDGWWLLRASNTQAVLVARAEAKDRDGLDRLLDQVRHYLSRQEIDLGMVAA